MEPAPINADQLPALRPAIGKTLTIRAGTESDNPDDFSKYLDAEVVRERLERVPAGSDRMLITGLWMSGLRISEILALKKEDCDFRNYTATVRWLKNRKFGRRIVPLHPQLRDLLEIYTARLNGPDRIFPITRQRAFQICQKWMGCSPHQLRHSFAVHYLRSDGLLVNLSKILGHADIRTTMEYQKIVPRDLGRDLQQIRF